MLSELISDFENRQPTVDSLFLYTARPFDEDTGLQNNLNRWYDPAVGRWLSEDPIGFAGGDENLYRYVGNGVLTAVDTEGTNWLTDTWEWIAGWFDAAKTSICPGGEPLGALECAPGMAHAMILSSLRRRALRAEVLYGPGSQEARDAWDAYNDASERLQDNVQDCLDGR